jgi:hypothetical protein
MHISLDSALGRQKRLNSVGESVLQIAPDAAAAYSLRSLTGGDPDVVRVRRESDNTEKDFSGSQIESGEMARWVNEQPTLPLDLRELDTNTGERDGALIEAAAAYSLRKLKEDFTGDVVEVRRNVDGETEGFTAAEVTDGTLESFVNASFDNELPLDQATGAAAAYSLRNLSSSYTGNVVEVRRSSDNAVQSFTASEVADGTMENWVNAVGVARNRTSVAYWNSFTATSTGFDAATSAAGACGFDLVGSSGTSVQVSFDVVINSGSFVVQLRNGFESGSSVSNSESINSSGSKSFTLTATSDFVALQFVSASADVEITNFSIDVPWTYDGHVKTWYDQSGSDNHAVQTDTAKQPKIVEGGTYLEEVDFDGSQQFQTITLTSSAQPNSVFSVSNTNFAGQTHGIYGTNANQASYYRSSNEHAIYSSGTGGAALKGSAYVVDTDYLRFDLFNGANSVVGVNGTTTSGTTGDEVLNRLDIGDASLSGVNPLNGGIKELILYTDDQSDKRRAIEENISNHYDISLAAFSRDGTVKTWYDQSGSTNDATQTDPAKQPKIVEGGNLLKDSRNNPAIVFDDVNDNMDLTSDLATGGAYSCIAYHEFNGPSMILKGNLNVPRIRLTSSVTYQIGSYTPQVNQDFTVASTRGLVSVLKDASHNARVYANGTESSSGQQNVGSGSSPFQMLGTEVNDGAANGKLVEVIYYESDQTDNRTALEANIGETYGITDIPAADDTVNGFVQTWYDQSGSDNDAEQATASSQPKIVGEVTSGQPHAFLGGLDFDGVDDELSTSSSFAPDQPITSFIVSNIGNAGSYFSFGASTTDFRFITSSAGLAALNAGTAVTSDVTVTGEETLLTAIGNTTASSIFKNGTSTGSGDIGTAPTGLDEGLKIGNWHIGDRFADGAFKELIIYNSDQSSNRPAIEANINNQYDIY